MKKLFNIYGKARNMKRFRPIDLKNNKFVVNLFHASMLPYDQAEIVIKDLMEHNPNFTFEMRSIK